MKKIMGIIIKIFSFISDVLEKLCKFVGGFSVFAFVCVISLQVILRNFFRMPVIWANDVSIIFFVWAVFFGAAVAVRYRKHFVLDIVPPRFKIANCALDIIAGIAGYIFFIFIIQHGWIYTVMGLARLTPSLGLPQAYFSVSMPIAGAFMVWFNTGIFISDIKRMASLLKGKDVVFDSGEVDEL